MESTGGGIKGKRRVMWICCTPKAHCSGSVFKESGVCFHGSPEEVHRCQEHYLIKVCGYTKISKRVYSPSDGGYIRIFAKRPVRAKPGKEARYMAKALKVVSW